MVECSCTLLWLAGIALALIVAIWAHLAFWNRRLDDSEQLPYDEFHRLELADGAPCELRRLKAQGDVKLPPILMIHGIAFNHRNVDANAERSLPRWLRSRGRDVWLLTLRSGLPECARDNRVTFESMVRQDLPVAVAEVLKRTGAAELDCLGFSMGGMLLYAWLGTATERTPVRRVVIMGSPGLVRSPLRWLDLFRFIPIKWVPGVRIRRLAQLVAFVADHTKTPFHHLPYNPDNVRDSRVAGMLVCGVQDIAPRLHQDFARSAWGSQQITVGQFDVLDGLKDIGLDALFVAGGADRLASTRAVRAGYEAWDRQSPKAERKFWLELSLAAGASADYGHGDLILGDRAIDEVYKPVERFLDTGNIASQDHALVD